MRLPIGIADLTPSQLNGVLDGQPAFAGRSITSVLPTQINVGVGFTGRVYRLELSYEASGRAGPPSAILKLPSDDPEFRSMLSKLINPAAEIDFYRDLAGEVGVRTPKMYFGEANPTEDTYALVLEDLAPASFGDDLHPCTEDEAVPIVRQLATMHARWWNSPRIAALPFINSYGADAETWQQAMAASWAKIKASGVELQPDTSAVIDLVADRWPEIARRLDTGPVTLVHGDVRLDNLCFPSGFTGDAIWCDWQAVHRGLGTVDLSYLLAHVNARDPGVTQRLTSVYQTALASAGVQGYSLERCERDRRVAVLYNVWLLVWAFGALDTSMPRGQLIAAGGIRLLGAMARREQLLELLEAGLDD